MPVFDINKYLNDFFLFQNCKIKLTKNIIVHTNISYGEQCSRSTQNVILFRRCRFSKNLGTYFKHLFEDD